VRISRSGSTRVDAEGFRVGPRRVRIGGQQFHLPAGEAAGHARADPAQADDADGLAEEEVAAVTARGPLPAGVQLIGGAAEAGDEDVETHGFLPMTLLRFMASCR
jgi:hypothetical protein